MLITITQKNWDGKGNDRTFEKHPMNEYQLSNSLRSIVAAYHLPSTEVRVDGTLVDPRTGNPVVKCLGGGNPHTLCTCPRCKS